MARYQQEASRPWRRPLGRGAAYIALAALLAMTALAWNAVRRDRDAVQRAAFEDRVDQIVFRINRRLGAYETMLRGGAALAEAMTPDEWRRYAGALNLSDTLPAMHGLGFARRVDRGMFEAQTERYPESDFRSHLVFPEEGRLQYGAVVYLVQREERSEAGNPLANQPEQVSRAAVRDAGSGIASAPAGASAVRRELVLSAPVRPRAAIIGPSVTPREPTGWVFALVDVERLARSVVPQQPGNLAVRLYDGQKATRTRLVYANAAAAVTDEPRFASTRPITAPGGRWSVEVAAPQGIETAQPEWWVLASGVSLSLLVFSIMRILASNRDRALALAGIMTEQLRRANERLEGRVVLRTRELADANGRLLSEMAERETAEQERTRALAQEQNARAEAESANRAKDDFMAVLSHELRTPLNAIQSWAQVLEQDARPRTVQRATGAIKRNVETQARLIDNLLELARVSARKIPLERRSLPLAELVAVVTSDLQPTAAERGVRIHTSIEAPDARVYGDPERLRQVAWNLLSNAIKFTPAGGVIDVRLARHESQIRLSVTDTGEGIGPEFLPHVFAPFRQADSSSRRRQEGLGLGLALVKSLVELHGGTIEVASAGRGHGTSFVVSLPAETGIGGPRSDAGPVAARRGERTARLAGCAILAIDDHADALDALTAVLEFEGARVTAVESSRSALTCLERALCADAPDVILCDIALPDEDGYTFLRQLRGLETRLGISEEHRKPVVAVTAYAQREHRDRALAAGFFAHVPKPIDTDQLVEAVLHACARRASGTGLASPFAGASRDDEGDDMRRKVHGEGNYAAAREFGKRTRRHLRSSDIEAEARDAAPRSREEAAELERAEAAGKRHVKEEDPALKPARPEQEK